MMPTVAVFKLLSDSRVAPTCAGRSRRPPASQLLVDAARISCKDFSSEATRNKCIASSNRCLTSSNKKLLGAPGIATSNKKLLGTSASLLVTRRI